MDYRSVVRMESASCPGVWFTVRKMTFGRRLELAKLIRELGGKLEFASAGEGAKDAMDAAVLGAEIDAMYLRWGLESVEGLSVDGAAATAATIVELGPERLTEEILTAIKRECGLTQDERKN